MSDHTPGPWRVSSHNERLMVASMATGSRIGGMGWTKTDDTSLADARLIAAAPDMLAALQAALEYLDNGDSPGGCDGSQNGCDHCAAIRLARSAIAKTKGTFK